VAREDESFFTDPYALVGRQVLRFANTAAKLKTNATRLRDFCFPGSDLKAGFPPIKQPLALKAEALASPGAARKWGRKVFTSPLTHGSLVVQEGYFAT